VTVDVTSTNPVVKAILSGTAPPAARMAAARGLLPIPQADLLEALVALRESEAPDVASAAQATLDSQDPVSLLSVAESTETAPSVLGFLASSLTVGREVHEKALLNNKTPDKAVALLAGSTPEGSILELISINQQRLIRAPEIIEALLANPARTPEAARRARETKSEFFEKERGARQVADELRARGNTAAAEFVESSESLSGVVELSAEDVWAIAQHIEVADEDIDDSWLAFDLIDEIFEETYEQRVANTDRIITDATREAADVSPERISLIRRIMMMTVKDRIKLGMKGDREARSILIRDSNKLVATAVIHNPRITEHEVENIAAMRTIAEEVLRLIAMNRAWARSYSIIHNLARNPRTPIATAMGILPRIRQKELIAIQQNRNVSEAVRRQAQRLAQARAGHSGNK
jgi:hypothetical protein